MHMSCHLAMFSNMLSHHSPHHLHFQHHPHVPSSCCRLLSSTFSMFFTLPSSCHGPPLINLFLSYLNVVIYIIVQVSTSKSSSAGQNLSIKPKGAQRRSANGNGKQLLSGRNPVKGSVKQRLHPGMLSSQDRATAHYGAVTGLKVTEDGMCLLSAGKVFSRFCLFP